MPSRRPKRSPQTTALTVLTHSTLVDAIYAYLSVPDILNLQKVSWQISEAVFKWLPAAYSIENHFRRFFDDPMAFRVLQAQTGTIVSGSNALQFFERSYYPDSDLDIYTPCRHSYTVVKWLVAHNYVFRPTEKQTLAIAATPPGGTADDFFRAVAERHLSAKHGVPTPSEEYGWSAIEEVFTFIHKDKPGLKVQLIVVDPRSTPVACVLYFHTTIVMNFITWDRAYSLFPSATFLTRTCLTFGNIQKDPTIAPAYTKYWRRGFKISALPLTIKPPVAGFKFGVRWTDDKQSWVIKLSPLHMDAITTTSSSEMAMDIDSGASGEEAISQQQKMEEEKWACRSLETHIGFTLLHVGFGEFPPELRRNPDKWEYRTGTPAIYFQEVYSPVMKTALIAPLVKGYSDFMWHVKKFLVAQEEFEKGRAKEVNPLVELGEAIDTQAIEGWKYWDLEVFKMWPTGTPGTYDAYR